MINDRSKCTGCKKYGSFYAFLFLLLLCIVFSQSSEAYAQHSNFILNPLVAINPHSSEDSVFEKPQHPISVYTFAALGGFIPMRDSYRINYATSIGGLPIEVSGGFIFPITQAILTPVTFRYERRTANFIDGTSIAVFSIEPGIRFYLEPQHGRDFRIFGAVEGLLAQANVTSKYDAMDDANSGVAMDQPVMKNYFDLGTGFDLGLAYPLSATTALDGIVHTAIYFGSSVASGGIGNIGGVSLTIAYRFGF